MKTWFRPSWHGDFRLEADGEKAAKLIVHKPTTHEKVIINSFLGYARAKGWTDVDKIESAKSEVVTTLSVNVAEAGLELVRITDGRKLNSLTGVRFSGGQLEITETTSPNLAKTVEDAKDDKGAKAATTTRPTPSCPSCMPGAVQPASEVLLAFLTQEQHRDWARHRVIQVEGNLSGHRYLLAHRNSRYAREWGRICYDADDRGVLHFFDWSVPPEEEVLAALFALTSREHWLRNEATCLGATFRHVFKNPFGNIGDGTETSAFTAGFGRVLGIFAGLNMTGVIDVNGQRRVRRWDSEVTLEAALGRIVARILPPPPPKLYKKPTMQDIEAIYGPFVPLPLETANGSVIPIRIGNNPIALAAIELEPRQVAEGYGFQYRTESGEVKWVAPIDNEGVTVLDDGMNEILQLPGPGQTGPLAVPGAELNIAL